VIAGRTNSGGGTKLRSKDDHWEFADWRPYEPVRGQGWQMIVECEFGDHYLAQRGAAVVAQLEPFTFESLDAAWAAVERWNREHRA